MLVKDVIILFYNCLVKIQIHRELLTRNNQVVKIFFLSKPLEIS
jgi:hypothetical protein